MKLPIVLAVAGTLLSGAISPAAAQESRAAIIEEAQTEKAQASRPHEPGPLERAMTRIERVFSEAPSGFYPYFDSVYAGGGFALGPGYRWFYGDRTFWDVKGLISIRAYKLVEIGTSSPGHAKGRLDLFARAGWREATQVAFYGTGMDTPRGDRTNFDMKEAYATGSLVLRPSAWTVVQGGASLESYRIAAGRGRAPSTLDVFTLETAPGVGARPTYLHTTASAGVDWRPAAGYARRGGRYELTYHNYLDRDGPHGFDRLDAQIIQHVPVLRENWVFSFRGRVQTILNDSDVVPYFMLPALGTGTTLRAYNNWRFRDRHSLLGSAEWRWIPNGLALDMALFVDAGKVTSLRGDLNLDGLKGDVGIGARFHGPSATMFRIDLARGSEGMRLVLSGGPVF